MCNALLCLHGFPCALSVIGKELIACETAVESFLSILSLVGGPNEKNRAKIFLKSINILPDLSSSEENTLWSGNIKLRSGKKIQNRTFKIFTFGIYHKAITITANKKAADAAKIQVAINFRRLPITYAHNNTVICLCFVFQGFSIPVIIHEARALSEQKQETAQAIE